MGWKFWRSDRSEAELSLERLRQGVGSSATPAATRPTAGAAKTATPGSGFWMTVEDVFSITGRGTVVTGQVAEGTVTVGMPVTVLTAKKQLSGRVTGIEMFRKTLDTATAGDNVGLLLDGVLRAELGPGDTITG